MPKPYSTEAAINARIAWHEQQIVDLRARRAEVLEPRPPGPYVIVAPDGRTWAGRDWERTTTPRLFTYWAVVQRILAAQPGAAAVPVVTWQRDRAAEQKKGA